MVELNRLSIAPLRRAPGTGRAGGVPASPGVPTSGVQAVGQAGRALGQSLGQAGAVLNEVLRDQADLQQTLATQQANAAGGKALLASRLALENARRTVLDNPEIGPGQRLEAFSALMAPVIAQQRATLPLQAQGAFDVRMAGQLSTVLRTLGDQAALDVQADRQQTLTSNLANLQTERLLTNDPVGIQQITLTRQELIQEAEEDGTLTPAGAVALLEGEEDKERLNVIELMIRQNPENIAGLLSNTAFFPDLDPKDRFALIELVNTLSGRVATRKEQLSDRALAALDRLQAKEERAFDRELSAQALERSLSDRADRAFDRALSVVDRAQRLADQAIQRAVNVDTAAAKKHAKFSNTFRAQQVIKMTTLTTDEGDIEVEMEEARRAFDDGKGVLEAADLEFILSFGKTLLKENENITRNTTDPNVLQDYYRLLMTGEDNQEAVDFAMSHAGSGLAIGSVGGLVSKALTARDADHFRNLTEVQDALRFVGEQLFSSGDPLLDDMMASDLRGIRADAQNEFLVRIAAIAGKDGLNKEAVIAVAPAIRDAVVRTHRTRLQARFDAQQGQDPNTVRGFPQTQSTSDACKQWRFMRQQGVSTYEADAFLGRELARHIARDTPSDQPFNAIAVQTELAQCLGRPIRTDTGP